MDNARRLAQHHVITSSAIAATMTHRAVSTPGVCNGTALELVEVPLRPRGCLLDAGSEGGVCPQWIPLHCSSANKATLGPAAIQRSLVCWPRRSCSTSQSSLKKVHISALTRSGASSWGQCPQSSMQIRRSCVGTGTQFGNAVPG